MKIIDTVAIIGYLNPRDKAHRRSLEHINSIASGTNVFVPVATVIEADLVMKIRGYTYSERELSWRALESKIPSSKMLANSISSIYSALSLQQDGMDYFDSLISSLARETHSIVLTKDRSIEGAVEAEW